MFKTQHYFGTAAEPIMDHWTLHSVTEFMHTIPVHVMHPSLKEIYHNIIYPCLIRLVHCTFDIHSFLTLFSQPICCKILPLLF